MKKIIITILLIIIIAFLSGCELNIPKFANSNNQTVDNNSKVDYEKTINKGFFCTPKGDDLECLSFKDGFGKLAGYYNDYDEFGMKIEVASSFEYELNKNGISSTFGEFKYNSKDDTIEYDGKTYTRNKYSLVENYIEDTIKIVGTPVGSNYNKAYCTKVGSGLYRSVHCYSFNANNVVKKSSVYATGYDQEKMYYAFKGNQIYFHKEGEDYASIMFYKIKEDGTLILSYTEDFSEGNTYTYVTCDTTLSCTDKMIEI